MRISLSRCWLQWCRIGLLASTRRGLNDIFPLPELLLLAQTWHFSRPTHRNICMNLLWQVVELELEGCHATFTLKNNFIYRQRLFQAICHLFIKVYIRTTFLFNRKKIKWILIHYICQLIIIVISYNINIWEMTTMIIKPMTTTFAFIFSSLLLNFWTCVAVTNALACWLWEVYEGESH